MCDRNSELIAGLCYISRLSSLCVMSSSEVTKCKGIRNITVLWNDKVMQRETKWYVRYYGLAYFCEMLSLPTKPL